MLIKLIFITAAYMHDIARASGDCGKPELADNMLPVSNLPQNIGAKIRIQCAEGYVRKAGTSNQIRCTQQQNGNASWHSDLPLKCIPDPKKPHVATTETQRPPQQFTSSSTERTARKHPILHGTSSPTTGHIALKTTNEVVTTKSRRTTSQPTLMSTTKETESITTTNETTTSYTSKEYMTTTSSHTLSGSFTTITGINASVRTSTISEGGNKVAVFSDGYTSTIGGVTGIILLCLVAVFIFWWLRHKNHRNQIVYHSNPDSCTYIPVCESEHSSAQSNKAAENSTEESVIYKNPGIPPHGPDTCDKLLPQTDS